MAETSNPGEAEVNLTPTLPENNDGQLIDDKVRQPIYERKLHRPESAAYHIILQTIRSHREEFANNNEQPDLPPDLIDAMLLELIALSDESLIKPKNNSANEQQRKRIEEYGLFQDKAGDKLADAFLESLEQEKQILPEKDEQIDPAGHEIEENMARILSYKQVRDEALRIMRDEHFLQKRTQKPISKLIALEGAIDTARARYRQIQNESRSIDPQSTSLPTGVINHNLGKYLEIIEELEQRVKTNEARLSDRELGLLESSRLLKTRHQMREFGFAMTESRQKLFDRISELASAGYKIFLGGPTGTGKTSLAVFATRQILNNENQFEVVSWSPEMTTRDLFGKPIIKSKQEGQFESAMQKGPYAHMLSGETRGIINDEFTSGQTSTQLSLKRIWQAHSGEEINLPGFNGQVFTKENYLEISTGNLRSKQHQQREEMDPAVAREFVSVAVSFMDSEEAKRVLLSSFMHEAGFLPISKNDVMMIDQLCRVAEYTQKAFEGKFSAEERQSDLYRQIEPSGAEIHLTKTFLDSGTLFRLVSGVSGRSFLEHLKLNLDREINGNPHLDALPQEKEAFKKILKVFGFNVDATSAEDFYTPASTEAVNSAGPNRPYILPSEMGFLSDVEKINIDEFVESSQEGSAEGEFKQRVNSELSDLLANREIPDSVKEALSPKDTPESTKEALSPKDTPESTKEAIETQIVLMEKLGITREGKINPDLIDSRLKEAGLTEFPVPTSEQIQEALSSQPEQVEQFFSLGLTRIILEPIACALGTDLGEDETTKTHQYSGLLEIVADKLRAIGQGNLKGSDGTVLGNFNSSYPIFINSDYENLQYSRLKDDKSREDFDKLAFVQDQLTLKGWSIKFTTPDILLKRERVQGDPLASIKAKEEFSSYAQTLSNLGLSGSTPESETILLLDSLDKTNQVTNDYTNPEDAYSVLSGASIKGSSVVPGCAWRRVDGSLRFGLYGPGSRDDGAVGRPVGELKI